MVDVTPEKIEHVGPAEVPEADAERPAAIMLEIMSRPPSWAQGLPLNAEGKIRSCFGK